MVRHENRNINYLAGLVKCGLCGAARHATNAWAKTRSRFKYYVCNNRYNHHSCKQEYIRADILEASVIQEISKLAERREVVSELVREFTEHNRTRRLPDLGDSRQAVLEELEGVRGEREKLSRWLSGAGLTAQAVGFINSQVDRLFEQEGQVQERLWAVEDEIQTLQTVTYNAQEICDQLGEFVRAFPTLSDGERKLVVDSLIREVSLKHQEVAVALTPPLAGLGFLSTLLAPKEEKHNVPELRIYLGYDLAGYNGVSAHGATKVGTGLSAREYTLHRTQRTYGPGLSDAIPGQC